MNKEPVNEAKLWSYIDGTLSGSEKTAVEALLALDAEWKSQYEELLELSKLLHASDLETPSLRFTKNVMEAIGREQIAPATRNYINQKIIWSLGFFFIVLISGFLIYGFSQVSWSTGGSSSSPISRGLSQVDFNAVFNNTWVNIFIMVNIILGLFLFDHFLQARNKKQEQHGY